jgi:hypothetical protein
MGETSLEKCQIEEAKRKYLTMGVDKSVEKMLLFIIVYDNVRGRVVQTVNITEQLTENLTVEKSVENAIKIVQNAGYNVEKILI